MKVDVLTSKNQPTDWFDKIVYECSIEYPMNLVVDMEHKTLLDIGANVGGFTYLFGNKFENIFAVEASSYNVSEYKKRHTWEIIHKAISSVSGETVKLKKYMDANGDTNSGNFSLLDYVNTENNHGWLEGDYEEVETISLEDLLEKTGPVGLLKIDVEGSEFDALYGKDLSSVEYITGEFHYFIGADKLTELFKWIDKTHIEIYSFGGGVGDHYIKVWKRR